MAEDFLKVGDSEDSNNKKNLNKQSVGKSKRRNSKNKQRKNKPYTIGGREIPAAIAKYEEAAGPDQLEELELRGRHSRYAGGRLVRQEEARREALLETARAEQLHTESAGLLQAAEGYRTTHITQQDIHQEAKRVTQHKMFTLTLPYGPYKFDYLNDGRQLALAGEKGHLASFDWLTKKSAVDLNLKESLHDVCFLEDRNRIAVAQKKYVSIYDDKGTEVHVIRQMSDIHTMSYSRPHMLLTTFSLQGFLSYLDVSIGKLITSTHTGARGGQPMAISPYSGVTAVGECGGVVSLWTPNSDKSVMKILAGKSPLKCVEFGQGGRHMVVGTRDRRMSVYDARNFGAELCSTVVPQGVYELSVSQTGLVAVGGVRQVLIYSGLKQASLAHYMKHALRSPAHHLQFCPYDEVLGVSTLSTFQSLVVPGSGEARLDSEDSLMFQTEAQRGGRLIRDNLNKIPHELITLDPHTIRQMDEKTTAEKMEERKKLKFLAMPKFNPTPRHRMRGKSGSAETARRKEIIKSINRDKRVQKSLDARKEGGVLEDEADAARPKKSKKEKKETVDDLRNRFNSKSS